MAKKESIFREKLKEINIADYLSQFNCRQELIPIINDSTLDDYYKKVVFLRLCGLTYLQIGELGGVSGERARQIFTLSYFKLRRQKAPRLSIDLKEEMRDMEKGGYMADNNIQRNLKTEVFKRFMSQEDLDLLLKQYKENLNTVGGNRESILSAPLDEEEKEIIKFYILDTNKKVQDFTKTRNIRIGAVYGRAQRIALRVLFQHPEIVREL